jgi:hypothetical protein
LGIKIDIKNSDIAKILHKIGFLVEMYENDHPLKLDHIKEHQMLSQACPLISMKYTGKRD